MTWSLSCIGETTFLKKIVSRENRKIRENRKMPSFKQELMSIYDASSVIHPIPEYKTSKHGIMYTNIICKDEK